MKKTPWLALVASCRLTGTSAAGPSVQADVMPLISASCLECHDTETRIRLNLESLGYDLTDPETFRQWVKAFDRVQAGEMPPPSGRRPDEALLKKALGTLEDQLRATNLFVTMLNHTGLETRSFGQSTGALCW